MKASVKDQWITDLRSGEFEQGPYSLDEIGEDGKRRFCCLGVLCRQAVRAGVIPEPELHGGVYNYLDEDPADPAVRSFYQSACLPVAVKEWAGLPSNNPLISPSLNAAEANDEEDLSFVQIANLIEQNVPAE